MISESWIDSFLEYLKSERNYSDHTISSYSHSLLDFQDFCEDYDDSVEWGTVDTTLIREWMVYLFDELGLSTGSVNVHLSALRSFFKYLRMMSLVDINPMAKITGPKKSKPLPSFIKESDMDRLLDMMSEDRTFSGVRNRLIVMMFYETGMRRAEMLGLKTSDIDLAGKQVKVLGKRNKQRIIPFGKELEEEILLYLELKAQVESVVTDRFLLLDSGKPVTDEFLGRVVRESLSLVTTQKKRSPHVLRHSFATAMLNNDADLGSIQKLLGHQSLVTTEVYTHLSFEELKDAYRNAHPRKSKASDSDQKES